MNKRDFIKLSGSLSILGLAGCQTSDSDKTTTKKGHKKVMAIFPNVKKMSAGWQLEVMVVNEYNWDTSFYDIRLLAYTTEGTKLCETQVGDLIKPDGSERTVKITCPEFPVIITATARESPCENALIPVVYWVGTDAQKTTTLASDEIVWKDVYRKCGEELPPQRVLRKVESTSKENG